MSAPLLALDSSTVYGSAAVGDESGIFAETVLRVAGGHSSALLPAVDRVLVSAGLRPADLGGVVVGGGPGSFTGLRIAAATAKGMISALELPLYAYSGLLACAAQVGAAANGEVCAMFDARRRDVYAAVYRFDARSSASPSTAGYRMPPSRREASASDPPFRAGRDDPDPATVPETGSGLEVVVAPTALTLDDLLVRLASRPPAVCVGEAASTHREEIESALMTRVIPPHFMMPRASALIWLAMRFPEQGYVADGSAWEPDYVRASGAERIAAQRRGEPLP